MQSHGADVAYRDFFKEPFTRDELERLIGDRPITDFLSTRAKSYKAHGWDRKLPPRREIIAAILRDPTLLKRPILVYGNKVTIGFSQALYDDLMKAP